MHRQTQILYKKLKKTGAKHPCVHLTALYPYSCYSDPCYMRAVITPVETMHKTHLAFINTITIHYVNSDGNLCVTFLVTSHYNTISISPRFHKQITFQHFPMAKCKLKLLFRTWSFTLKFQADTRVFCFCASLVQPDIWCILYTYFFTGTSPVCSSTKSCFSSSGMSSSLSESAA